MSRACIIILAGYACVVRSGTAQDQAYHLPPNVYCVPRPKNIRVVKKISKIVLGLEAEPCIRGLRTIGGYYTYY